MTFVHAFYSFNLEINDLARNRFTKTRLKIPLYPYEALTSLYARVVAFAHAFEEGMLFGTGSVDEALPTLLVRTNTGEISRAIEVGATDVTLLRRILKRSPHPRYSVYFTSDEERLAFCKGMRGSTTNWIDEISFYQIPAAPLESLTDFEATKSTWNLTIVDDIVFLGVNELTLEFPLPALDMWHEFQQSLLAS